ncbi:4Fe-4S binding protein [Ideonella sp. DXS29W]|uniref:4Fe-4S binding protein n=1 Tax=Ideonella lacteola TaxID=2984193 RepID=A0ABU9BSS7_9BURK
MPIPRPRSLVLPLWRWAWIACLAWGALGAAQAGVMTRDTLQALFPAPLMLGERDTALPVWPVFKQEATATVLVAYVFESIDLAPVPGFSGTPMNLLVALDAQGRFMEVRVLSQHEPVFLDGLGEGPLLRFVEQYRGLSLQQGIKIGDAHARGGQAESAAVYIDGVAKATASVRILNQSLLAAALKVARAKLGYAAGRDPAQVGQVRADTYTPMDWAGMIDGGLLQPAVIRRGDVDAAFAGSGFDAPATPPSDTPATADHMQFWLGWVSLPALGRNLLGEAGWQQLKSRLDAGDHALIVVARGSDTFVGEHFVRGAVPDRLSLRQGELPIELRDLDLDTPPRLPAGMGGAEWKVFRVSGAAGLDPAQPWTLAFRVTRHKGIVYPERLSRDFMLPYRLPAAHVTAAAADLTSWQAMWRARAADLAMLLVALGLLTWWLWGWLGRPGWWLASAQRLARWRTAWLVFTLAGLGWWAQGQLSIVNLTALIQALRAGHGLTFFLFDPISVVLWAYVAITLWVWGRGTFCGWLCPFGALQELVAHFAARLRVPQWRPHRRVDARWKRLKYGVLALLLGSAALGSPWADSLVEIEPFKTAITLGFQRAWPHLLWAGALLALSAVVYKGYCRYLCPLGAALALGGRLRRWAWIARRAECGTPCQTCRHRCEYQAIGTDGRIDYEECFQCLECVAIHRDASRCAPLIAQSRGAHKVFPIRPAPPVRLEPPR